MASPSAFDDWFSENILFLLKIPSCLTAEEKKLAQWTLGHVNTVVLSKASAAIV